MKKSIKGGIAAAVVVAAGFAAHQTYGAYGTVDNSLLMQNVEALTSAPEPGEPYDGNNASGNKPGKYINICSKKSGKKFCTPKRGNRKWALPPIKVSIYNSEAEINNMIHHVVAEAGYESEEYDTSDKV